MFRLKVLLCIIAGIAVILPAQTQDQDLVDTAIAAGSFNTLVAAVQAAGLEDALRSPGPITVFAPTDAAFAQIPAETLNALLEDPPALRNILLYHAVAGEVLAADVVQLSSATTLQGEDVTIAVNNGNVMINNANVVQTDIRASNGIIHVIDTVLLPPEPAPADIVDTAIGAGSFNTLVAAVQAAGLEDALRAPGPVTVFAPTDNAFAQIPAETLNALLEDPEALRNILLYHVVSGEVLAADVVQLSSATTLQGEDVTITVDDGNVMINNANVVQTDIRASNGIIHVIDTVLLPPPAVEADIVDTAIAAGRFNTLVAAVQAAGLEDALRSSGPFTVFAPNDDAFAQLPPDTLNALLADPIALAEILLFHVAPGQLLAEDVVASNGVRTLEGSFARFEVTDEGAFVQNARILTTDILTSNGVIHEIDSVILPPAKIGDRFEVSITNVTKGQVFSPPLLVSHRSDLALFQPGQAASSGLSLLAEDGNTGPLANNLITTEDAYDVVAFGGPIAPGETRTAEILAQGSFRVISAAGMLTSTNDSFFAGSIQVRTSFDNIFKTGSVSTSGSAMAFAWDAGSEFNSEDCSHIPGAPCGNPGMSPSEDGEGFVYISNGVQGDGDLAAATYDWRGPVAIIKIKRK